MLFPQVDIAAVAQPKQEEALLSPVTVNFSICGNWNLSICVSSSCRDFKTDKNLVCLGPAGCFWCHSTEGNSLFLNPLKPEAPIHLQIRCFISLELVGANFSLIIPEEACLLV